MKWVHTHLKRGAESSGVERKLFGLTSLLLVRFRYRWKHLVQVSGACPLDPSRPTKALSSPRIPDLVFDDFEKQHTALIALLSVDETANLDPETQQFIYSFFENDVSVNNQTHIVRRIVHTFRLISNSLKFKIPKFDDRIDSDTVTKFEMSLPPDTAVPAFQVLVDFLNKTRVML
ncbi:hypothetical protein NQ317_015676 [Molorchus minor]|uniref:Uncharacterized protein n=1 Tax=Molorchus minor TaxID=1323400 RepID=A0ABQ9ITN2_9CUCU|nr:hypothetical protein NQ317_015676 [Molorchus minor]